MTFLFTDVEGSTRLWAEDEVAMSASLEVHDRVVREAMEAHGGHVFTTAGDSFAVAFGWPSDAVAAATAAQQALGDADWPGPALKVRMGLHLGEAEERGGDYFGSAVNTAARIEAAGHGGQILLSSVVRDAAGVQATDLGEFTLKDVAERVRLFQLGDGAFPPLRSVGSRSNLPVPATRLVGRDGDIRAVRLLLGENRLVTLTAVGGSGKTRLALAVADAELAEWRDGVWFADLTKAVNPEDVGPTVAGALGLQVLTSDHVGEIARYLAGRRLLLVLDNCEHVIDACAELAEAVLAAGGAAAILATSREWLDVAGERVFQVPSLDATGEESPAVQLFVDRATAVAPDFELDDSNLEAVSTLCRRLDGVPLAIELAAARAAVLSPAMLVEGLADRFRLLSGGRRRQRGRTLEATIDWSYDLLEQDEQQLFRVLGVFAGSFDLSAVAAVADVGVVVATDLVESLYGRSLVASSGEDDGEGRFRLLETLKAYAEDRLVDAGEAEGARDRHARHFLEVSQPASMLQTRDLVRVSRLVPDMPNLLVAADWFESGGRNDELAGVLYSIGTAWGVSHVGVASMASMIPRSAACRARIDNRALIDQLHLSELMVANGIGDWPHYIASCRALRNSPLAASRAMGHLQLITVTARLDPRRALAHIERFVELWADSGLDEAEAEAVTLSWRLIVAAFSNDLHAALDMVPAVLAAGERSHAVDAGWLAALSVKAVNGWLAGDTEMVRQAVGQITTAFPSDDVVPVVTSFLTALAELGDGPGVRARDAVRAHVLNATSGRLAHLESDGLMLLAELTRLEGDPDDARDLLRATSSGRSPGSILAGHQMAERLGIHAEIEAAYAANVADQAWMHDRPRRALVAEIERRGWTEYDSRG